MRHFSVLLVDDEKENILEEAEREFPSGSNIRLKTANDKRSAEKLIKSEFFHMALVDPGLSQDDDSLEGNLVLSRLKELRPSCERIILTNLSRHEYNNDTLPIVAQMHPTLGSAQGILIKTDVVNSFRALIGERAGRWLQNCLEIDGARIVADKLSDLFSKRHQKTKTSVTADEIDFLVSRVFGQGEPWNLAQEGLGIRRVTLELIPRQGFSLAAVVKATCYSKDNVPGVLCVLKFATPEHVQTELARYSQYVRFRLAVHHRVELLGWSIGDNFGVLCYNFAGIASLSDLFLKEEPMFFGALDELFAKQSWYSEKCQVRLGEHFHDYYRMNVFNVLDAIRKVAGRLEHAFNGSQRGNELLIGGATVSLPGDILDKKIFSRLSPGCVVHGDMHCDNVLVGERNVPMLIDYFSVGNGPRAIDLATLESNVRLLALLRFDEVGSYIPDPRPDKEVISEILALGTLEEGVWNTVWRPDATIIEETKAPLWARASIHLGKLARKNFEKEPSLTEGEYAATCMMWGFRLFKVKDLSEANRVRLLVWISNLVGVLRKCL